MPTRPSSSSASSSSSSSAAASTLRGGRANLRNASVTFSLFMPPGTIVPMGAYCFYCVRTYVRTLDNLDNIG